MFDKRYEILRLLGSGGMADVYLAHDKHLERDVALKILHSRYARDEDFIERFRREARNAAGLNHPNIAQIYDRGEAEDTYYIAMEYVAGLSLKEIINKYAPLETEHLISIARQILEALGFAHRKDVIHRDIKPQNIIVDDDGQVKVTDFGIARAGSASTMTEAGSILGTAHYLSPEQARGEQVRANSDLYSLGVVMYEMATGEVPFTGDNAVAIAMKHAYDDPRPMRDLRRSVPEDLEAVVLRALAKDAELRYASAGSFLSDLKNIEDGKPVASLPYADDEGATRVMRREAVPGTTESTRVRTSHSEGEERERSSARSVWPWILVIVFLFLLAIGAYALVNLLEPGVERVGVPGLGGKTEEEARSLVEEKGLEFQVAGAEKSSRYGEGRVVRQDPKEGTKLETGRVVQVWLAAGEGTVMVPDLVGKSQSAAGEEVGRLELSLGEPRAEVSTEYEKGIVVRQEPAAETEVSPGTLVNIWVSVGPETPREVILLNLVGMNQDRAVTALEELKLIPKIVEVSSTRSGGEVDRQSPKAKTRMAEGSVVTIYVSNSPIVRMVVVPDVKGLDVKQAEAALRIRGLEPDRQEKVDETRAPGTVIAQSPRGGTEVKEGSKVSITVVQATTTTNTTTTTTTTTVPSTSTTTTNTTIGPPKTSTTIAG